MSTGTVHVIKTNRAAVQSLGILFSTKIIVLGHYLITPNICEKIFETSLMSLRTQHLLEKIGALIVLSHFGLYSLRHLGRHPQCSGSNENL
jgi:hypothetical protein